MTAPVAKAVAKKAATNAPAVVSSKSVTKNNGRKSVTKSTTTKTPTSQHTTVVKSSGKTAGAKISSAKRTWMPTIRPAKSTVRYRQLLVAEMLICIIIVLTGLAPQAADKDFSDKTKQAAAILFVFLILSVMTSAGPSTARVSAALGGVIMLTLLLMKTKNSIPQSVENQAGDAAIGAAEIGLGLFPSTIPIPRTRFGNPLNPPIPQ